MARRRLLETVKRAVRKAGAPVTSRLPSGLVEKATRAVRTVDSLSARLTGRTRAPAGGAPQAVPEPPPAAASAPEPTREERAGAVAAAQPAPGAPPARKGQAPARPVRVDAPGRAPRSPVVERPSPDGRRAERSRTGTRAAAARAQQETEGASAAEDAADTPRASGRKTASGASTAPRRATARKPRARPAFKAKRGQKHRH